MPRIRIIVQLFFVPLLICSTSIGEEKQEKLWSLVYPDEPKIPEVENISWVNNSIDSFILEKIESQDLQPSERANKHKLVRRAYLDLLGIPPTIEEAKQFTENQSPNAWEELIDELLSSPRYGERWGRHWLDVARYSDTNGMDENIAHPEAYRYRDYVIKSFNLDKPFNQFIIEQLAGDLLPSKNLEKKREQTIASGFLSVGPKMLACDDPDKMRRDIVDEQLDTTGRAFMGMTFGCARCHDHKFDPISIEDYYGLAGIFMSFQYPVVIPGVNNTYFLRAALNAKLKHQGLNEINAADFMRLIREKLKLVNMDEKYLSRAVNDGFSGGEKKRNEILQMALLEPVVSILDETDSGLDIDALRIVAGGVNQLANTENATLLITHYQRLLDEITPDFVHVMAAGRILRTGGRELALELEKTGYDWVDQELAATGQGAA